ncbi:MAG TPA: hypothetical protein VGQ46_17055 [Thermoanaerobaculia bacterium]|nr:hypothetical protein [Thermoanaerobaculia bacterium]
MADSESTHDPRNPRRKNTPERDEEFLRQRFEHSLQDRVRRRESAPVHAAIPAEWFAAATRECRDLYVDGHFYGTICLSQAVAEGISKFLAIRNGYRDPGHQNSRNKMLKKHSVISLDAYRAFKAIEGEDRNDYHHLNANIETDLEKLEERAGEGVRALFEIQIEVFAFSVGEGGTMVVTNPHYWPRVDDKYIATNIDFT